MSSKGRSSAGTKHSAQQKKFWRTQYAKSLYQILKSPKVKEAFAKMQRQIPEAKGFAEALYYYNEDVFEKDAGVVKSTKGVEGEKKIQVHKNGRLMKLLFKKSKTIKVPELEASLSSMYKLGSKLSSSKMDIRLLPIHSMILKLYKKTAKFYGANKTQKKILSISPKTFIPKLARALMDCDLESDDLDTSEWSDQKSEIERLLSNSSDEDNSSDEESEEESEDEEDSEESEEEESEESEEESEEEDE